MTARGVTALCAAAVAALAAPAGAAAPLTERWSGPYSDTVDCGDFTNEYAGTEHVAVTTRLDRDGEPVAIVVRIRFRETDTNTTSGESLPLRGSVTETYDLVAGTRTLTGAVYLGTEPGGGTYIQDTGRVVFDLDSGAVMAVGGPHEGLESGVDELVCAALA